MRGVVTRRAHHAAARMRAGPAQIQPADGRPITRAARHRPHHEHLIQAHFTVEDIAAGEAEAAFQIERRQHLLDGRSAIAEAGRVFFDEVEHAVGERLTQFIPSGVAQTYTARIE